MRTEFSVEVTFTDISVEMWRYVFNEDPPLSVTDPDLDARLRCEGALA